MGSKEGKARHRDGDIFPMYQGDQDHYGGQNKVKIVLRFMRQTMNHRRIMGVDNLSQLRTWVDSKYGLNPDMKSHIGSGMQFGYGLIHYKSIKENEILNVVLNPKQLL